MLNSTVCSITRVNLWSHHSERRLRWFQVDTGLVRASPDGLGIAGGFLSSSLLPCWALGGTPEEQLVNKAVKEYFPSSLFF